MTRKGLLKCAAVALATLLVVVASVAVVTTVSNRSQTTSFAAVPPPPCDVTALSYTSFRHYDPPAGTPFGGAYVTNFSNAVYITPGQPIPGGWQPEGQPPVLYNTVPFGQPGFTDPRQARFARAWAQRTLRAGEMATVDISAYVVGGGPCTFAFQDHEHKVTHPNTGLVRADFVWWRDPQFSAQNDSYFVLNPASTAGQWIRFNAGAWQQRSSGGATVCSPGNPCQTSLPKTVMDSHTGSQERNTGLSAVNVSVGWLQAAA